jgi:glycogen operon protein
MVSYNERHNLANGESNADGHGHNLSNNCGVEGPSDKPSVNALRARLQRALLATTLLAQGTPMLCAGDELGHSQKGNNNPYCQDNDTTWIDWVQADHALVAFTTKVLTLRRQLHPLGNHWYSGLTGANRLADVAWMQSNGAEMRAHNWADLSDGLLGCLIGQPGRASTPLLLLFNPHDSEHAFVLPAGFWRILLDTAKSGSEHDGPVPHEASFYPLQAHSVALLQLQQGTA